MNVDDSVMVLAMLIIAIVGWSLFILTAGLYLIGNKINVREEQALALFGLAALFSDEFRSAIRNGFEMSIREAHEKNVADGQIVYGLMRATLNSAKRYHDNNADEVNTLRLVLDLIAKVS